MARLDPTEYESRTGITKVEYEARILAGAHAEASDIYADGTNATIEAIEIDGVALDTSLVILFRIPERPDCLFGSRLPLWPIDEPESDDTPEGDGSWHVQFGVDEYVGQGGLVVYECAPDGVTWLP